MPAPKGHPNYNRTGKGGRPSRLTMVTEAAETLAQSGKRMALGEICDLLLISERTAKRWQDVPPDKASEQNERFCRAINRLTGEQK